ncbi:MAG: hypothetical protein HZB81_02395 [Deltaproteobacteria bacterium]|nr:hypothetical protein [Deltaproteobacteria bacterium]
MPAKLPLVSKYNTLFGSFGSRIGDTSLVAAGFAAGVWLVVDFAGSAAVACAVNFKPV